MTWRRARDKFYLVIGWIFFAVLLISGFSSGPVYASQITARSLELQGTSPTVGGSEPGAVVNDLFTFTVPTAGSIGSIQFQYCTTASGTCTLPTGLVTTSAAIGSQSGATGFSINNATNGTPYIYIPTGNTNPTVTANTQLIYQLTGITNPTTANQSFYVRIATFTTNDTSGTAVDTGNVAASTANQIVLTGQMPESLVFCAGGTVSETSGVPDCTTATSGAVSFNQLFSPTSTATAQSQMAASTNAGSGYVITVNGATLQSGSNSITAVSNAASTTGKSQFGMNLVANTTPVVGAGITPTSDGVNYKGEAKSGYATTNSFTFNSGDTVADSADGGAGPTDAQIYTVSYIVNVPGNLPAGTYTTTLTYICTATF